MRLNCLWNRIKDEGWEAKFLKNCCLVIDGQNFFFNSYENSKLPFVFGAEANEYAKFIREKLQMFKNANVECYVVFKGSDTDIDSKIRKLWLTTFNFGDKYTFVAPVLMKEIYKQVLKEEGVKYATSVMESKDDCVALAQRLQCSVLSEDKEFYLKGIPYIPYNTLKYMPSENHIMCKQYSMKGLFDKYSLTVKKVAIFLALTDDIVFSQNYFANLLTAWHINNRTPAVQLEAMLLYLSTHNELEVLNSISELFTIESERTKLMTRIEQLEKSNCNDNVVVNYLMDNQPQQDRLWFKRGVASQKIATEYVYLYKHQCIMGSWAIEKNDAVDSIMLSIDILKFAYNLLSNFPTSDLQTSITVYQSSDKYVTVNIESDIKKPLYHCKESVFENGWSDIKELKLFEHFLEMNFINTNTLSEIPIEARMLIIALVYFSRKKTTENNNIQVFNEVYCFIVSYVMLNIILDEPHSIRKIENGVSENDCIAAKRVTEKYFRYDVYEARSIFNENTLKTLVEFQYCLLHMNHLNTLCGSPYMTTKYHRTFNGTFIYKLLKDMEDSDGVQFVNKLFERAPSVSRSVNSLISVYKKVLYDKIQKT